MTEKSTEGLKQRVSYSFLGENYASLEKKDLELTNKRRVVLKNYKQSDVRQLIENSDNRINQRTLRDISELLYEKSTQYKRLIHHFSGMPLFSYVLTPAQALRHLDPQTVKDNYQTISEFLSVLNIRHEMGKIMVDVFKKETFFGYVHQKDTTSFIQPIPNELCMITSVEDGVYNFSIDMSAFDKDTTILDFYPDEFRKKYKKWKANHSSVANKNKQLQSWVELDSTNTICIKLNEVRHDMNVPMFAGTFESIFDIDGFKQLRKDKEELQNYMILSQELPIRKDSEDNNDFLIDNEVMRYFHNTIANSLPDNVALITSPMPLTSIKFDKDTAENDGVTKAERAFWEASGTSQALFNSVNGTSSSMGLSIQTDEAIIFTLLTQVERWVNRYLKLHFERPLFQVSILPATTFNQKELFDNYLKASQFGIPVKSHIGAVLGLTPMELLDMAYVENELFHLTEEYIPLQSSHTKALDTSSTVGRPEKEATELSDDGERTRDNQ